MTEPDYEPLIEFIRNRAPWFTIGIVPALAGQRSADVVLRIDGSYAVGYCGEEIATVLARRLRDALVAAQIIKATRTTKLPTIDTTVVRCSECHRLLRADESRAAGVGPVCRRWLARRAHDFRIKEESA